MQRLLTEKALSEVLGICRVTLFRFRREGMPYIRLGARLVRYDFKQVQEWFSNEGKEVKEPQKCGERRL